MRKRKHLRALSLVVVLLVSMNRVDHCLSGHGPPDQHTCVYCSEDRNYCEYFLHFHYSLIDCSPIIGVDFIAKHGGPTTSNQRRPGCRAFAKGERRRVGLPTTTQQEIPFVISSAIKKLPRGIFPPGVLSRPCPSTGVKGCRMVDPTRASALSGFLFSHTVINP